MYVHALSLQLSTSYYVYNISRNLHHAEKVFLAMGYKRTDKKEKESLDFVYEGEVNIVPVLETATDLLVMHEEVVLLQEMCDESVILETILEERKRDYDQACLRTGQTPEVCTSDIPPVFPSGDNTPGMDTMTKEASQAHELTHKNHLSNPPQEHPYMNLVVGPEGPVMVGQQQLSPNQPGHPGYDHLPPLTSQRSQNQGGPQPDQQHATAGVPQQPDQQYVTPQLDQQHTTAGVPQQPDQQYATAGVPQQPDQQYATAGVPQQPDQQYVAPQADQQYANIAEVLLSPAPSQQQSSHVPISQYQHQQAQVGGQLPWVGEQTVNPTVFQNYPVISQNDCYSSTPNPTHVEPHTNHASQVRKPPSPRKPVPAVRKYLPRQPKAHSEHKEVEETNIHRTSLDHALKQGDSYPTSPPTGNTSLDNLPPPVTDFTSPTATTPYHIESGIQSGLVSGITGEVERVTFDLSPESGPQALTDDQLAKSNEQLQSVTSPNPPLRIHGESSASEASSIDIYGSGPTLQYKTQPSVSTVAEEQKEDEECGHNPVAPLKYVQQSIQQPSVTTQGSGDRFPHEIPSDAVLQEPPKAKQRIRSKAQSVDEVEHRGSHGKGQAELKPSLSGSNLLETESRYRQGVPQNLQITEPSPTVSEHRSSKEYWNPSAISPQPPSVPSSELPTQLKIKQLPPKAKSVDSRQPSDRAIPRFSSGSNLLNREPDTPVRGLIPAALLKIQASKTEEVSFSKPLSHVRPQLSSAPVTIASSQPDTNTEPLDKNRLASSDGVISTTEQPSQPQKPVGKLPLTESKPPFPPQKTTAVVSPTTAVAGPAATVKPTEESRLAVAGAAATVKPTDESRLEFGDNGTHAHRQIKYAGESSPRQRANATNSKKRQKSPPPAEEETPFIEISEMDSDVGKREELESTVDMMSEIEQKFGINLQDMWECSYCTQLNAASLSSCEVCHRMRESIV